MLSAPTIRLLEPDNNRRGDLFGRLMADLFVALGYEQPRLNIHKSGREIDLSTDHRLEPRRAIAECKATSDAIGGDDLNKFVGSLDVERADTDQRSLIGYFISLSGFRETAIEQEKSRQTKIVTLTGQGVVKELIEGRIIISTDAATELAGRCCTGQETLTLDSATELLAHRRGWIWLIYYTQGKQRTHFALIHADGTPLASALVDEVVRSDLACGGSLGSLICLNPPPARRPQAEVAKALAAYRQYLTEECGFIQLDGLPADNDLGSRRLRLESLFVPVNVDITVNAKDWKRQAIGPILSEHPRLALLAPPGGGKSTLLKRLAVAYADAERREQIGDDLPSRNWLPLFFRCRELRTLARGSFSEILDALADREPLRPYAAVFRAQVDRELLAGRVLLLVDGLDEISDPGDRAAFVGTIRTALQAYPGTAIVVTSREAGFRHVAAHLTGTCLDATLSAFDQSDIERLCLAWHQEVLGHTEKVRADARQLAADIVANDRIRQLAVNPLLLTTLLLVKRWVGSLPTRRTILYNKAVEVLLMTWNTEGHEPIPEDEALPQLCYIASAMMIDGIQKISRPQLRARLKEAREALPTELGYVKGTVEDFIHRVEDRSSLLMMTGHDVEDGILVEFFEFRHLTFQEFLTARAMVDGWHPGRQDTDTLASVLSPRFRDDKWREVIPLAALLGGKATETLMKCLTAEVRCLTSDNSWHLREEGRFEALSTCLADEVPARPETIRSAMQEVVRLGFTFNDTGRDRTLARGRYGADFREEARRSYLCVSPDYVNARYALLSAVWWQTLKMEDSEGYLLAAECFVQMLKSSRIIERCEGALGFVGLCFAHRRIESHPARNWAPKYGSEVCLELVKMLFSESLHEQHAAMWGLGLVNTYVASAPLLQPITLGRLFKIWQEGAEPEVRSLASWAIARSPVGKRDISKWRSFIPTSAFQSLTENYEQARQEDHREKSALLHLAWYLESPWSEAELRDRACSLLRNTDTRDEEGDEINLNELPLRHLLNLLASAG